MSQPFLTEKVSTYRPHPFRCTAGQITGTTSMLCRDDQAICREENNVRTRMNREVTDTHRRCSKCREWKWLSAYYPKCGACKECVNTRNRARYARLNPEQLDAYLKNQLAARNRRKREASRERKQNALFMVESMKNRGLSQEEIARRTGVTTRTLRRLVNGEVPYIKTATVRKLQAGYRREVMA